MLRDQREEFDIEPIGPEPPTFYATNVPATAQKWGDRGQKYTFLAESPEAMKTAQDLKAPRIMKGYQDQPIGPEPKPGELEDMDKFNSFWGHVVKTKHKGRDPLSINPAEESIKAEEEARNKYALELMNRDPRSVDYKKYEKLITAAKTDAMKRAEWERRIGEEDRKMALGFFKQKMAAERKAKGPNPETRANVQAAQKYTEAALFGPNSWQNYELTEEDLKKINADKNFMPKDRKVKPRILTDVNRVRGLAGLPPITEAVVDENVPMEETTNFTPWGPKIPFTGKRSLTEKRRGFQYREKPPAAGKPQVIRTGMHKGRKVFMYSDGRVVYAPN